jgi:diguanylate cyclase (GGDEF)-like protein/PAS domain S-box-containing protein
MWVLSALFIIILFSRREANRLSNVLKKKEKYLAQIESSKQILQQLHTRMKITFDAISDAIITTYADGSIESLNPAAEKLIGATELKVKTKYLPDILAIRNEECAEDCIHPIEKVIQTKTSVTQLEPVILIQCTQDELHIIYTASPILDKENKLLGVVWVFHDMSEQKRLQQEISYKALHDELTGLWNRYAFNQKLAMLQSDCDTFDSSHVLIYIDLDRFKVVNDTAGHIAGDELLKQITHEFTLLKRESDTLARLGGDEFGLLCENCPIENALKMAEKIRLTAENFQFKWEKTAFKIGVSIGLVSISKRTNTKDIISKADMACYQAKENGRNRIHVLKENDIELKNRLQEMSWISRIEAALRDDKFVLYSQKITGISSSDSSEDYKEILIRLYNDKNELIYPDAFIPAAERFGLMWKIDQFVAEHSYRWLSKQPLGSVKLSINLSGQSLGNPDFLSYIENKINQYPNLNPFVIFEITETATIRHLHAAQTFMETLIKKGIHFSLDDFGTGLSSFAYLKNMPVSHIKIDGIFVKNMDTDLVDAAMVASTIQVAKTLNMKVIAEFVENETILNKLKEMGVDYAQGYYVEKPKPLIVV